MKSGALLSLCGIRSIYNLTEEVPATNKAYLGRSAGEATPPNAVTPTPKCSTEFRFTVDEPFTVRDNFNIQFSLGCDGLPGVIQSAQSLGALSIDVNVLKGTPAATSTIATAGHVVPAAVVVADICGNAVPPSGSGTPEYNVAMATTDVGIAGQFETDDTLTVEIILRSVNVEPELRPYWFLLAGADAKVTAPGLGGGEDDDGDEGPPGAPPPPDESAPVCSRDQPTGQQVTRTAGQSFDLRARCTDADDDLDHGAWLIDDEFVEGQELGSSPSTAQRTFNIENPGTYQVEFEPEDQAGNVGTPAAWTVTITEGGGQPPPPSEDNAPTCIRQSPPDHQKTHTAGDPFTLEARCTDEDNDLDHGDWKIGDDFVARDELGDSPDTADQSFTIEEPGTYDVHFVPKDEAGHFGSSATWRITVTQEGGGGEPSPTPTTTPIPFFPSGTTLVLGAVGALGGTFLVLRRR